MPHKFYIQFMTYNELLCLLPHVSSRWEGDVRTLMTPADWERTSFYPGLLMCASRYLECLVNREWNELVCAWSLIYSTKYVVA